MRIVVDIDNGLGKKFRKAIIDRFGTQKGALKKAVNEAIINWLEKQSN